MNFILTTQCLSKCKFCFVPDRLRSKQEEMLFLDFKRYIDHISFIHPKDKPAIGILGGEPTLAKDFPMIAGYLKSYKAIVRLYSNLITDTKKLEYLIGAKNIILVWNAGAYLIATKKNQNLIVKNLKLIKKYFKNNIIASITLYPDFKINDFDKTIKIFQKYKIKKIRIALDSKNHKAFMNKGDEVFRFCKYLADNKFEVISSYCGHFLKGMFSREQAEYLKQHIINFNYNDCSKNFPMDIFPDGSVVPCMGFANLKGKVKLTDYKSLRKLKLDIIKKFKFDKITNKNRYCISKK
ncbi:MAG: radical SAM protein [Endomicrobiaceae bacterium]|nr:radical SAM protein [Endomicrobiaceae bacterium]